MTSTAVERRGVVAEVCTQIAGDLQPHIKQALPEPGMLERYTRVALTAIQQNPDLLKGEVSRTSVYNAVVRCAQDGLLPDGREAAFTRFGKDVVYMPMVGGFRKKAAEQGFSLVAYVVYSGDEFDYSLGERPSVHHKPPSLDVNRGNPIGAYAVALDKHGNRFLEVMSHQEIEEVRSSSRTSSNGPWAKWWGEMARKTVARRLFKQLPLGALDQRATAMLEADDFAYGPLGHLPPVDPTEDDEDTVTVEPIEDGGDE